MDKLSLSINGKTINATLIKWQHLRFYNELLVAKAIEFPRRQLRWCPLL